MPPVLAISVNVRYASGKSDPLDAVSAARAAQSGRAAGAPKGRDDAVEAIRALMVAKRSARNEPEFPPAGTSPSDGFWEFVRYGKGDRPRRVYITAELAGAVDFYRDTTRRHMAQRAQHLLRRKLRAGELVVVDGITLATGGKRAVTLGGHAVGLRGPERPEL